VKFLGSLLWYAATTLARWFDALSGKAAPPACIVLCYHAIAPQHRSRFARQMDMALKFSRPIRIDHKESLAPGDQYFAVTFDDGHRSVAQNAHPELSKREIPCAIFVITDMLGQSAKWSGQPGFDPEDKYFTSSDLRGIPQDLVTIGSHSCTHERLPFLSDEAVRRELSNSRQFLEKLLGRDVQLFAFPHGDHNESLLRMCKDAGYTRVFTVEPVSAFSRANEFICGRVIVDPSDWPIEFWLKIRGAYRWLSLVFGARDRFYSLMGRRSRVTTGDTLRRKVQAHLKAGSDCKPASETAPVNKTREKLVTAVIPTRGRPGLLLRALQSALTQDYKQLEVVVVLDGPDPQTTSALQSVADSRLRVVQLPESRGGAAARNAGVLAAWGDWIAFLDDDDEWLPGKISKQMEAAQRSDADSAIVAGQAIARTCGKELVWPRKAPFTPISEYLFSRKSWSFGEGLLLTSTLLAPRALLVDIPFTSGLRKHQDLDWVLRALARSGTKIEFIPEPLAFWNLDEGRSSVSRTMEWKFSWDWIRSQNERVTQRAYAGFIATQISPQAARQKEWRAFFPLLFDMFRNGRPSTFDVAIYISMWCTPLWIRRVVRFSQS